MGSKTKNTFFDLSSSPIGKGTLWILTLSFNLSVRLNRNKSIISSLHSGTGAECRKLVQELNIKKADLHSDFKMIPNDEEDPSEFSEDSSLVTSSASNVKKPSKWDKYL